MDEKIIGQLIAELVNGIEGALGAVTTALCQQLDASRFSEDLRTYLLAATATGQLAPMAKRLTTAALAAADAQSILQRSEKH